MQNTMFGMSCISKNYADQIVRRCVPESEVELILHFCHLKACGGHFNPRRTIRKMLESGLYWPNVFKDSYIFFKACSNCQQIRNLGPDTSDQNF